MSGSWRGLEARFWRVPAMPTPSPGFGRSRSPEGVEISHYLLDGTMGKFGHRYLSRGDTGGTVHRTSTWAFAAAIGLTGITGCSPDGAGNAPFIEGKISDYSCKSRLEGSPSIHTYETLRQYSQTKPHLTCPFNYQYPAAITIFTKPVNGSCEEINPAGFADLSSEDGSPGGSFKDCSDVFSGEAKKFTGTPVDSYIWLRKNRGGDVPPSAGNFSVELKMVSVAAGFPFVDDDMSNVGLCWEEPAGTNLPPTALFGSLGIKLPGWATEQKFVGQTCDHAVDTAAKKR